MKKSGASTVSRKALLGGTAIVTVALALTAVPNAGYAAEIEVKETSMWKGSTGDLSEAAKNDDT